MVSARFDQRRDATILAPLFPSPPRLHAAASWIFDYSPTPPPPPSPFRPISFQPNTVARRTLAPVRKYGRRRRQFSAGRQRGSLLARRILTY